MKLHLILISLVLTALPSLAEYRLWTNSEGKTAKLDLVWSFDSDGEKVGEFLMTNGKKVKIKASQLSAADAKYLTNWIPKTRLTGPSSAFDKIIGDHLLVLEGDQFEQLKEFRRPQKYYVFYYTAKWCGPCRQFTPELVKWYKKNQNDNFELVLITSDNKEEDMLAYAKDKKITWPHLRLDQTRTFKRSYKNISGGIPSLVVYDRDGKLVGQYRSNLSGLSKLVR